MTSEAGKEDALWEAADVAAYLKMAEGTITQWVKQGRIPFVKVGSRIRFRRSDIRDWVDARVELPPEEVAS